MSIETIGGIVISFGIPLFLAIIGLSALVGEIRKVQYLKNWLSTQAVVLETKVVAERDREGDVMHSARVSYEYQVEGQTYTGTGSLSQISSTWSNLATAAAEKYPPGQAIPIIYNPANPAQSSTALTRKPNWLTIGIGSLFGGCGLCWGLFSIVSLIWVN
jgi:hypothetical protein